MHWCAVLVALLFVSPASSALADTQTNNCGRYSIWVPDGWKVTINGERIDAESRDNEINIVVAPIEDKSADLLDEDVTDFISEEIEKTKFVSDRRDKIADLKSRFIEGTGYDDGDITFKAIAIDPGENVGLIELVIYAAPAEMDRPANKEIVDRILRSFRPK
jgi:hypothetical protein